MPLEGHQQFQTLKRKPRQPPQQHEGVQQPKRVPPTPPPRVDTLPGGGNKSSL